MANSAYYYRQYTQYNKQVKDLKNKRSELEKIDKEFYKNPVQGDPEDYNKKIKKALSAHSQGLAGDRRFSSMYSALEEMKESAALDDRNLNGAHWAINEEIRNLNNQISDAQRKADQNWKSYQNAKYQEKIEAQKVQC